MGTALTERQLSELSRLTTRVFLCFDADAAGEDATLRGMELALRQGFDVRVVALPKGKDPADEPATFEARLADAESYAVHRVRLELARARDRQHAYLRVQDVLNDLPESPERHEAWRLANDQLGLTVQLRAAAGGTASAGDQLSPRLVEVGDKLERSALAGVRAHPALGRVLAELGPEHFDSELHRQARDELLTPSKAPEPELVSLLAGLDALAEKEGIDEETAKQRLLRLRERRLRREFEGADEADLSELQHKLAEIRTAIREFA
jgi:DNA primase